MGRQMSTTPTGAQTLLNGLHVVQEVARGSRTQTEIQEHLHLPRSTVHRLVSALRSEEFLRQSEEGLMLGPALISLGFAAVAENNLAEVSRPILMELAREAQDTVHLAVEEQGSVLYLAKISGTRGAETRSRVGLRMPLTRTGIGKSLLLDRPSAWRGQYQEEAPVAVRRRTSNEDAAHFVERMGWYRDLGFTLDVEENEPGIRCVAAPVRGPQGNLAAAISVTATTPYMPTERMRALVPVVQACAARISRAIGGPEDEGAHSTSDAPPSDTTRSGAGDRSANRRREQLMDRVFDFS